MDDPEQEAAYQFLASRGKAKHSEWVGPYLDRGRGDRNQHEVFRKEMAVKMLLAQVIRKEEEALETAIEEIRIKESIASVR